MYRLRVGKMASRKADAAPRFVRGQVNITAAQADALTREASLLGISKNELLRRVLDEWRDRLPKKATT